MLRRTLAKYPLVAPIAVGALLRLASAASGYGWFAIDDYGYAIEPAWRWLDDPGAPYPSGYRSLLFPRLFSELLGLARGLGASEPRSMLQIAYACLGLWSLAAIPAVYALARRHSSRQAALLAAWLVALQALMPRISTRALLETVAIPPLVWGVWFVDSAAEGSNRARFSRAAAGGALVGVAAMFRFQIGIIYPALLGLLIWRAWRSSAAAAGAVATLRAAPIGMILGGIFAAAAEGLVDVASGRGPFETVRNYLSFNLQHSSSFGVSAWYTYLLQLVMFTAPPATLVLARPMASACRRHATVLVALIAFVGAHSLIGHKEDRFLFSVLPLFFVPLGAALAEAWQGGRWARAGAVFFWAANTIVLAFATFSDGHRSVTSPLLAIRASGGASELAAVGMGNVPVYYLGQPTHVSKFEDTTALAAAARAGEVAPDYIVWRGETDAAALASLAEAGLRCEPPRRFGGDWVDRLLLAVNREHNQRRAASTLVRCAKTP